MKKVPLWLPLCLSIVFAIYGSIFFTDIKLFAFAPFFAITFQRIRFIPSLWICLLSGLFMDTISSQEHFGAYAICYTVVGFVSYGQKRHFFEEKAIALSLYTLLISSIFSLSFMIITRFLGKGLALSPEFLFSELVFTPFLDALYAFIWFTVPMRAYLYIRSGKWKKHFKKAEEETP